MNKFHQHFPTFFDVDGKPEPIDFNTVDELLNHEAFQNAREIPKFYRFEYSRDGMIILVVLDDGYEWYVIGSTLYPIEGLPDWQPKYRRGVAHD